MKANKVLASIFTVVTATMAGLVTGTMIEAGYGATVPSTAPRLTNSSTANPKRNIDLDEMTVPVCTADDEVVGRLFFAGCEAQTMAALNFGNATEGLNPVKLPTNFKSLTPGEQLFVLVNEQRTSRGLTPFYGISAYLSGYAQKGAEVNNDPTFPIQIPWTSDFADGPTPEYAVAGWMYADGPGKYDFNVDCNGQVSVHGCFGHRDSILHDYHQVPVAGVGYVNHGNWSVYTTLFTSINPTDLNQYKFTYTWREAVADGA